jgi:hypothetical protein
MKISHYSPSLGVHQRGGGLGHVLRENAGAAHGKSRDIRAMG